METTERERITRTQEKERQQSATESNTVVSVAPPESPLRYQQKLQQQLYSEHRASIVSAPAATARSSSISTITGVCQPKSCFFTVFAPKFLM